MITTEKLKYARISEKNKNNKMKKKFIKGRGKN